MALPKGTIAAIKISQKNAGIDDATYRAMLAEFGVDSCTKLNWQQASELLEKLKGGKLNYPGRPKKTDIEPQLKKIEAQLTTLGKPWGYAESILKRQYKIEKLEWATASQLRGVITALRKQQDREL